MLKPVPASYLRFACALATATCSGIASNPPRTGLLFQLHGLVFGDIPYVNAQSFLPVHWRATNSLSLGRVPWDTDIGDI